MTLFGCSSPSIYTCTALPGTSGATMIEPDAWIGLLGEEGVLTSITTSSGGGGVVSDWPPESLSTAIVTVLDCPILPAASHARRTSVCWPSLYLVVSRLKLYGALPSVATY